jgi:hypothetical protein
VRVVRRHVIEIGAEEHVDELAKPHLHVAGMERYDQLRVSEVLQPLLLLRLTM